MNEAHLFIGIGGIGVETLSRLKKAVYPDSACDSVRFLAIDTDNGSLQTSCDPGALQPSEMLSLFQPNMKGVLSSSFILEMRSDLKWMSVGRLSASFGGSGNAEGIRQIGRFCLFNRADEVKNTIDSLIQKSLAAAEENRIHIHIVAGLAGGTGSGCFIDTCYIVRQVLKEGGYHGTVQGYFYLPDVISCRLGLSPFLKQKLNVNGYAALRELNYLMNLKTSGERFCETFGGFGIDSDESPVDSCMLISGTLPDGSPVPQADNCAQELVVGKLLSSLNAEEAEAAENADGLTVLTCGDAHTSIPLQAYAGLAGMKAAYDRSSACGIHLHEADVNWRETLPELPC